MFWKKAKLMVVGKEEPDLHWEGIEGISYHANSEFNKKYVAPTAVNVTNGCLPTFEKVAVVEKADATAKIAIKNESKLDDSTIMAKPDKDEISDNILFKASKDKASDNNTEKIKENPTHDYIYKDKDEMDYNPAFQSNDITNNAPIQNAPSDNIDIITFKASTDEMFNSSNESEEEDTHEYHEQVNDYSFAREAQPNERAVRYSQSAHLSNALY